MILVVGKNSFIGREFLSMSDIGCIRAITHAEIATETFKGIDCVINFSFSPEMYVDQYKEYLDTDLTLARAIVAMPHIHYVMISSRKVYSPSRQWNPKEDELTEGLDNYGRNKLFSEKKLIELLGSRLTILRPGNVFGYEIDPSRKRFGAYLLNQLAEKEQILLTVSPSVRRDIIPVDYFCEVLSAIARRKPLGIFNVGSGVSLEIGQIASWLIEGYGKGDVVIERDPIIDEFQLDVGRLLSELGLFCNTDRIAGFTRELGRRLSAEK